MTYYGFLLFWFICWLPVSAFALSDEEYDKFLKNIDKHFDNSEFQHSNDAQDDFFSDTLEAAQQNKPLPNSGQTEHDIKIPDLKIPDLNNNTQTQQDTPVKVVQQGDAQGQSTANKESTVDKESSIIGKSVSQDKTIQKPVDTNKGNNQQKNKITNDKKLVQQPKQKVVNTNKLGHSKQQVDQKINENIAPKQSASQVSQQKENIKEADANIVSKIEQESSENRIVNVIINQRKNFSNIGQPLDSKLETKRELNEHIQVNTYQHEYSQLLFVAASRGDIGAIKALLDKGADINAQDNINGNTPLMYATAAGKISAMQYIISRGADINKITFTARNALHVAAIAENRDAFRILLKAGCNLSALDIHSMRPFDYVSRDREGFAVYSMPDEFSMNKILISCTIMNMQSCLRDALARGADIDCSDADGNTPLIIAVRYGLVDLIQLIFEYKPDLKKKNHRGYDVFETAAAMHDKLIIRLINELSGAQRKTESAPVHKDASNMPIVLDNMRAAE